MSPATHTSSRGFRRALVATISVLVLACAGLATASVLQGPRIEGAQLDVAAAVVAPASMRIVLDEAVAPLDEGSVTVDPETPITVQNDGDVVLIHFESVLEYDTSYTVSLAGVRATAGGVSADLRHEVRTPPFQVTWLHRTSGEDQVLSGTPGGAPTTLFTSSRIQDYLVIDSTALLVVTLDDAGASNAAIVAADGSGNREDLVLPGGDSGTIGVLEIAGSNIFYTYTSKNPAEGESLPLFDNDLFRLDLGGTHISEPVLGVDGTQLAADSIIAIPGSTAALIHTRAGDVLRYDPTDDQPPALVAKYSTMVALAGDRHRLSVVDAFGPLIYDFDDGSETRVQTGALVTNGIVPYIGKVVPVRDGRTVEQAVVPLDGGGSFDVLLVMGDGVNTYPLFDTANPGGSILNMRVTPNDRYMIVETSPGGADFDNSDGYEAQPRPRDVTTVVVDIWAGNVVAEWEGSQVRWPGRGRLADVDRVLGSWLVSRRAPARGRRSGRRRARCRPRAAAGRAAPACRHPRRSRGAR